MSGKGGGQHFSEHGGRRGTVFYVAPEALTYDVEKGHALYEIDRKRVTEIDEELVLSFMALGVLDPVQISVEESEKGEKRYVVADGRRRVFNAVEANKRLKKLGEPQIAVPALVPKGADEQKLSEIMVALNELKKPHSVMVKVEKASRLFARLKDAALVARAFGVETQTINIWLKLSGLCARGKITINLRGLEYLQTQPGEDEDSAWKRLRPKLSYTGRQLDEVFLMEPSAVPTTGGTTPPAPQPPTGGGESGGLWGGDTTPPPPPPGGATTPGGGTPPPGGGIELRPVRDRQSQGSRPPPAPGCPPRGDRSRRDLCRARRAARSPAARPDDRRGPCRGLGIVRGRDRLCPGRRGPPQRARQADWRNGPRGPSADPRLCPVHRAVQL